GLKTQGHYTDRTLGRKILDLYVYGSFHIALSAVLFTWFYSPFPDFSNIYYLLFIFFATWAEYSAHKAIGIIKVEGFEDRGRFNIIRLYRSHIFIYLVIGMIGALAVFLQLSTAEKWKLFGAGILSILYILPVFSNGRRLRDVGVL